MKKFLIIGMISAFAFAFNLNQTYTCETLGVSLKQNNQVRNIPNNVKTYKMLKKALKSLYMIKIRPEKKKLTVYVDKKKDTLDFVKKLPNKVSLYKTKESDLFVFVDANSSQIGMEVPSDGMMIYYQCK